MKHLLALFLLICSVLPSFGGEYVICSGGPALRKWEDLRMPFDRHDKYGGNFAKAAWIRMKDLRAQYGNSIELTWMIYRPSYDVRIREENRRGGVAWPVTYAEINGWAAQVGARIAWFDNTKQFVNFMNGHSRKKMEGFEYFGHSNLYCFMFDYSSDLSGASTCYLHQSQLGMLKHNIFTKDAYIKSWGCNTGKSMSAAWRAHFGVGMWGATDKTNYGSIGDNKTCPALSGGRWVK